VASSLVGADAVDKADLGELSGVTHSRTNLPAFIHHFMDQGHRIGPVLQVELAVLLEILDFNALII